MFIMITLKYCGSVEKGNDVSWQGLILSELHAVRLHLVLTTSLFSAYVERVHIFQVSSELAGT